MVDLNADAIELLDSQYDAWRRQFTTERDRLRDLVATSDLADRVRTVEHVGSTAVPELAAKDVVDVDVVVDESPVTDAVTPSGDDAPVTDAATPSGDDAPVTDVSSAIVDGLGGTHYENTATWHVVARRVDGQRFNVHVFDATDDGWKHSVATRDVLRNRPALREEYETLKRELAADTDDLEAYSRGKSALLAHIHETARDADDLTFPFEVPVEDSRTDSP